MTTLIDDRVSGGEMTAGRARTPAYPIPEIVLGAIRFLGRWPQVAVWRRHNIDSTPERKMKLILALLALIALSAVEYFSTPYTAP